MHPWINFVCVPQSCLLWKSQCPQSALRLWMFTCRYFQDTYFLSFCWYLSVLGLSVMRSLCSEATAPLHLSIQRTQIFQYIHNVIYCYYYYYKCLDVVEVTSPWKFCLSFPDGWKCLTSHDLLYGYLCIFSGKLVIWTFFCKKMFSIYLFAFFLPFSTHSFREKSYMLSQTGLGLSVIFQHESFRC